MDAVGDVERGMRTKEVSTATRPACLLAGSFTSLQRPMSFGHDQEIQGGSHAILLTPAEISDRTAASRVVGRPERRAGGRGTRSLADLGDDHDLGTARRGHG